MEYVAIALSALSTALGGLSLWVLSGLRSDISTIRAETRQNSVEIAKIDARCDTRHLR